MDEMKPKRISNWKQSKFKIMHFIEMNSVLFEQMRI